MAIPAIGTSLSSQHDSLRKARRGSVVIVNSLNNVRSIVIGALKVVPWAVMQKLQSDAQRDRHNSTFLECVKDIENCEVYNIYGRPRNIH